MRKDCGCQIKEEVGLLGGSAVAYSGVEIEFCPMHAAAPAFYSAVTGHEDPSLWRISWVETLVKQYQQEHDWSSDEDPNATMEAIATCLEMCLEIKAAIAAATPERQRSNDVLHG